jgi:hypothetical protein
VEVNVLKENKDIPKPDKETFIAIPNDKKGTYVLLLRKGKLEWVEAMPAAPKDGKKYRLESVNGKMTWGNE